MLRAAVSCGAAVLALAMPALAHAAPTLTVASLLKSDGSAYTGGWTNQTVVATFACVDGNGAAIPVPSRSLTANTPAAGTPLSATCTDAAGSQSTVSTIPIQVDKSPPFTFALAVFADGNTYTAGTWTNRAVGVNWICSDVGSSGVIRPPTNILDKEVAGATVSAKCIDGAGNSSPAASFGPVDIDLTAPVVTATATTADGASYAPGRWTSQDVTVTFVCTDAGGSGLASTAAPVTLATEVVDGVASGSCADVAGNVGTGRFEHVDIDRTAPNGATFTLTAGGEPYAPGTWTNRAVTVSATCADAASGIAAQPPGVVLSSEGAGQHVTVTCTDLVGNSATFESGPVDVDTTAPTISADTGGYVPGTWTKDDVTVTFACADELSGVASTSGPATSDGAAVTGSCVDAAGNTATATVDRIQVDKDDPTIAGTAAPGWHRAPVTVTFTCADASSGVASCTPPAKVATQGAGQSVEGTAVDRVGRSASTTVTGIDVDLTPPAVTWSAHPAKYGLGDTVTITCAAADALSGLASSTCADLSAPAWTLIGKNTLTATATDVAGNATTAATSFTVTLDYDTLCALTRQRVAHRIAALPLCVTLAAAELARRPKPFVDAYVKEVALAVRLRELTPEDGELLTRLAHQL